MRDREDCPESVIPFPYGDGAFTYTYKKIQVINGNWAVIVRSAVPNRDSIPDTLYLVGYQIHFAGLPLS